MLFPYHPLCCSPASLRPKHPGARSLKPQSDRPHGVEGTLAFGEDIILDADSLIVSNTNTEVGDTPVRTIIMGEAYLERKGTGKSQHFLCLIGEKGKVLLTFFAAQ